MKENLKAMQEGYNILQPILAEFIGKVMQEKYRDEWWQKIRSAIYTNKNSFSLDHVPTSGSYKDLIYSLDKSNLCKIIIKQWDYDFYPAFHWNESCRSWVSELKANRDIDSHIGSLDISARKALRALETMILLCEEIDAEKAKPIRRIYDELEKEVSDAGGVYEVAKPGYGYLFTINDKSIVEKTSATATHTINGVCKTYPVYRVRLDQLYYNDHNDRIASWISQYEEGDDNALSDLSREDYNELIQEFIYKSNPTAIEKTKTDIEMDRQLVPGVTLSDGRVVDGNRRFTCLRLLHNEDIKFNYFETVILDENYENNENEIKKLELAIQFGEESKVAYDSLDRAIGSYISIEVRKTITAEDYAEKAKEKLTDVKKRNAIAKIIIEFLEFMNVPRQYDVAREMDIYSCFAELPTLLKKCKTKSEEDDLKNIVFCNVMLGTFSDQRKYIRSLKSLADAPQFKTYIAKQKRIIDDVIQRKDAAGISDKEMLDEFIEENEEIKADLQNTLEKYLLQAKRDTVKNRPSKTVSSALTNLKEIDIGIFGKLTSEERRRLREQLEKLRKSVDDITEKLDEIEYSTSSIY